MSCRNDTPVQAEPASTPHLANCTDTTVLVDQKTAATTTANHRNLGHIASDFRHCATRRFSRAESSIIIFSITTFPTRIVSGSDNRLRGPNWKNKKKSLRRPLGYVVGVEGGAVLPSVVFMQPGRGLAKTTWPREPNLVVGGVPSPRPSPAGGRGRCFLWGVVPARRSCLTLPGLLSCAPLGLELGVVKWFLRVKVADGCGWIVLGCGWLREGRGARGLGRKMSC